MIPGKFERLIEDDKLVLRTRPSWFAFPGSWLLFVLSLILVYFIGGIFQAILNFFGVSSITAWIVALLPSILIPIIIALRRYRWSFELDQQHVRVKKGYLSESDRKIQLVAWVNIDSERSILGRFLDYGDLAFWSGDEKSRLTWWGVSSPAILKRYVESVRDGTAALPSRNDIANHETPTYLDIAGNPIKPRTLSHLLTRFEIFIRNIPGPERSAETTIDQPIVFVWDFLTDTNNFEKIIQGMWYWGELDRKNAATGSTFQKGYDLHYYVVNWEPPHRFSMGPTAKRYEYDFRLKEVGDGTHVQFIRRFNIFGWIPIFQNTVSYTIDALKREVRLPFAASGESVKDVFSKKTFTDPRDGYTYKIVKLRDGNWWLAENLRYEMPGSFPADEKPDEDILATNPSYDYRKYGRLYTWDAAQKASPTGWHLPSDREWNNMLKLYGGYGEGLGNDNGTEDTKILIRDELDIELGGFINATDYSSDNPPPPYYYGYFYGRMGGRFWSTARQFPFSNRGGIYYRFFEDTVGRDAENMEKAFSVRCIKN